MPNATTLRRPSALDLGEALAAELRRMIVRCTSCTVAVMCEPCHTADRLLARYDEADNDDFLRLAGSSRMRRRYALPFIALALPACSGPTINAHRAGDLYPTSTAAQPTTSAPEVPTVTSGAGPTSTSSTSTIPSTTSTATTVMQPEPEPVVRPQRAADGPGLASGDLLACIRSHEQGEAGYRTDTGNGFYGAYQFDLPTWRSVGGFGNPAHASPAEQDARALALYESRGLAPWPTPSRLCA